jgi:hypothetical protein
MNINLGYDGSDLTDPVKCGYKGKKILGISKRGD